jgi:hypothetical protein
VALATTRVTAEKRGLHIVTGGHNKEITRSQCSCNVFRVQIDRDGSERNRRHAGFSSERGPPPCVDERLDAGSLGSGSAEAPGVELMRVDLLLNLAPPLVRAALRLSDRSVRGLTGRRPFARHVRSRPIREPTATSWLACNSA